MRAPPQVWTRSCVVVTTVPYYLSVSSVSRFRFPSRASYSSRPLALSRSLSRRLSLFLSFSPSLSLPPSRCRTHRGRAGCRVASARICQRPTPVARRAAGSLRFRHTLGCLVALQMWPAAALLLRPHHRHPAHRGIEVSHIGNKAGVESSCDQEAPEFKEPGFPEVRRPPPRPSPSSWLRRVRGSRPSRKPSSSHAVGRTPGARVAPGRRWWAGGRVR